MISDAYLAGFTDAEGCVGVAAVNGASSWAIRVDFAQTRPETVKEVHSAFGGALRVDVPKKENWKNKLALRISSLASTRDFLRRTAPFLRSKHEQVQLILERFAPDMAEADARRLMKELTTLKEAEIDRSTFPWSPKRGRVRQDVKCKVDECYRTTYARGQCQTHYRSSRYREEIAGAWVPGPRRVPEVFHYQRQPGQSEIEYMAGFFDGDGNLWFEKSMLRIAFGQTDGRPLLLFRDVYGGGIKPWEQPGKRRLAAAYKLSTQEAVRQFLRDVQPNVIEKRFEVDLVLNQWKPGMTLEQITRLKNQVDQHRSYEIPPDFLAPASQLQETAAYHEPGKDRQAER